MLKEVTGLNETSEDLRRRWFTDGRLDLYVWQSRDGAIHEFQLAFDKPGNEKIIRWTKDGVLHCHTLQDGESGPDRMDASPLLGPEHKRISGQARQLFMRAGWQLEAPLYQFVLDHLPKT